MSRRENGREINSLNNRMNMLKKDAKDAKERIKHLRDEVEAKRLTINELVIENVFLKECQESHFLQMKRMRRENVEQVELIGDLQTRISQLRKSADDEKLSIDDLMSTWHDERYARNECYKANRALRDKVAELQRQLNEKQALDNAKSCSHDLLDILHKGWGLTWARCTTCTDVFVSNNDSKVLSLEAWLQYEYTDNE